ncbi:MAG: Hsp20/alpha crystallin family protein [Rhodospirillales bacterium]|nr:Hsp20/alpha crystallin family protein [Rhodospirillales bacterium]
MVRYSPTEFWAEPLSTLRRIQDEINRAFGEEYAPVESEFPPINIWRGEDGIRVTALIPGVSLADLDLTVHQNTLTIKGMRGGPTPPSDVNFHRRERTIGPFARTISLPYNVDAERVRASADNGILSVDLPRPETDKPRKIRIGTP